MNQHWTQTPTFQTPLGGPLSQASAVVLSKDPYRWHLRYWLNIGAVAMIRGEDTELMSLRIEMEHENIADPTLRTQIQRVWSRFNSENRERCKQSWTQVPPGDRVFKTYFCELDRMLTHKDAKMRTYLNSLEMEMSSYLRSADIPRAKEIFDKVSRGYSKLLREEAAGTMEADCEDE